MATPTSSGWALLFLFLLAVFARAIDNRHIDVDLWTRPGVRIEAGIGLATLGLGLLLARATSTTFEGRYASVMFPLFLLTAAFGIMVFASRPMRYTVLALLLIGGFWGGTSNALRSRTQAFQVANAIKHDGHPGRSRRLLPGLHRDRREPAAARGRAAGRAAGLHVAGPHRLGRLHRSGSTR